MAKTEEFVARIFVNDEQAKSKIAELEAKMGELRAARDKAFAAGDTKAAESYKKELISTSKSLSAMHASAAKVGRTIDGLSSQSLTDINKTIKAINRELSSGRVERGSEDWHRLTEALRECKNEAARIKSEISDSSTRTSSLGMRVAGWATAMRAAFDVVGGVWQKAQDFVSAFAQMDEALADTRKYTGLSEQAVGQLQERLKQMDTRTSREELNALAGAAGRLGITAVDDIAAFVDAADKIGVALGDDLGEGAVDEIGKLAMAFGEDETKGLGAAMLSTGSAVNELAQNSAAGAGYLVDFTARVAGVAQQCGLSQADILGFAAVMDENMQRDETASTAFANMMTKMRTETSKFASMAGMDVSSFAKLVNEDMNGAIIALAKNLNNQDGGRMLQMLSGMGIDGSRAVAVLSTLAGKIDDVEAKQLIANRAYDEGTSVLAEFDTMNTTAQAGLDKAKNALHELAVQTGEKLSPAVLAGASGIRVLGEVTGALIGYMVKAVPILAGMAAGWIAVNASALAHLATTKLQVVWNDYLVAGCKRLWAALLANPYTAVAAAVGALIGGLVLFVRQTGAAEEAMKRLNDLREGAAEKAGKEEARLRGLAATARDEKASMDERQRAIEELNRIIPAYNGHLDRETGKYTEAKSALDGYCKSLQKKYELEGAKEMLQAIGGREAKARVEKAQAEQLPEHSLQGGGTARYATPGAMAGDYNPRLAAMTKVNKKLEDIGREREAIYKAYPSLRDGGGDGAATTAKATAAKSGASAPVSAKPATTKTTAPDKARAELEAQKKAYQQQQAAALTAYAAGETTLREHNAMMEQLAVEDREARLAIAKRHGQETSAIEKEQAEASIRRQDSERKERLSIIEKEHQAAASALNLQYAGVDTEEKREAMFQEQMNYLQRVARAQRAGSEEQQRTLDAMDEAEAAHRLEREESYQRQLAELRKIYGRMSAEETTQTALDNLEEMHKKGLVSEEEYQQLLRGIRRKEAGIDDEPQRQPVDTQGSGLGALAFVADDVEAYRVRNEQLLQLREENAISEEEYNRRSSESFARMAQGMASKMQTATAQVNQILGAATSYYSACSTVEQAETTKKYDKQIEAAGKNTEKGKKLEEKKQKELAKIKTKYNKKAMVIEIAQAGATSAMAVLNAFTSAMKLPYPMNFVVAGVSTALALAQGALQIAAIKKSHAAQEAGYYEGGFTGGRSYRREAGVVHEGEFVANHLAVENPALSPMLSFIDYAQRNGTVAQLSAEDVRAAAGYAAGGFTTRPAETARQTAETARQTADPAAAELARAAVRLTEALERGIRASVSMDGEDGIIRQTERWNRMQANK